MQIEARLEAMGVVLPAEAPRPRAGVAFRFSRVRVRGDRAYVAGHGPYVAPDSDFPRRGKVGAELTLEQGYEAARLTGVSILASLKRELGDLDRVTAWLRVFGMVNSAPGFERQSEVINGFTDLVMDAWGDEAGAHSRCAVGMAELPFGVPVEIEAEVEIAV